MHKIIAGMAFAAAIVQPAPAQDYHKNFVECARELGLNPDASASYKLQSDTRGRVLRGWQLHSEAQQAIFNDCVARKASAAARSSAPATPPGTSAKGARRAAR